MKHVLFKIKTNKQDDWRAWCNYLNQHSVEAKNTMRSENCIYERFVMYEHDKEFYTVGSSLFEGKAKPSDTTIPMNKLHKEKKRECLVGAIGVFYGEFVMPPTYEVLYEFDLRDE